MHRWGHLDRRNGRAGRGGVKVGEYLIHDEFSTVLSAGSINGTPAEPGPGIRSTVNANAKLIVTGGKAVFAAGGVVGDPRLLYTAFIPAIAGRICTMSITYTSGGFDAGIDNDLISGVYYGIRVSGTGLSVRVSGTVIAAATVATGNTYQLVLATRYAGVFIFIRGGAFADWTMLYAAGIGGGAFIPVAQAINSGSSFSLDDVKVPRRKWLPSPLVSDGFGSAFGTSDGLGHAEGVAGGMGSGGDGVAWTAAVGTWVAADGVANASVLGGGLALATASAAADVVASVKVTRTAGKAGLVLRRGGTVNYVYVVITGTHVQVYKRISNTETNLQDIATTNVDGAALTVITQGSEFRIYYNNALVVTQTIADASVQSSPLVGLYTTDTGNTLDDFVVYARGTGGEYDTALDAL